MFNGGVSWRPANNDYCWSQLSQIPGIYGFTDSDKDTDLWTIRDAEEERVLYLFISLSKPFVFWNTSICELFFERRPKRLHESLGEFTLISRCFLTEK